jgi:predicted metal-dependent phosphoesterase TrpH
MTFSPELGSHAAERGIVLIPGVEACIGGKHVLLLNMPFEDGCYTSFEDVLRHKDSNSLVIAPHPYFPGPTSLDGQLEAVAHLFDAVEYSHFYTHRINFNKQAGRFAQKYRLPIVGNSDAHILDQLGLAYSLVEAEKTPEAIVQAIKAGRVEPVSQPLPLDVLIGIFVRIAMTKRLSFKGAIEVALTWMAFFKRVFDGRL